MIKKQTLETSADWILRMAIATIFLIAGLSKIFDGGVDVFSQHVNIPLWLGWIGALGEVTAGAGIIAGKLIKNDIGSWITKISGGLIMIIMVFAFALVKYKGFEKGFIVGIEGIDDLIALFAMGAYYVLKTANEPLIDTKSNEKTDTPSKIFGIQKETASGHKIFIGKMFLLGGIISMMTSLYFSQSINCKGVSAAEKGVELAEIQFCKLLNLYTPGLYIPHNKGGFMLIGDFILSLGSFMVSLCCFIIFGIIFFTSKKNAQSDSH